MTSYSMRTVRSIASTAIALAIGVLAGAGVALLYAPQSGRNTRSKLMSGSDALKKKVMKDASHTRKQIEKQVKNTNKLARKRVSKFGNQLQHVIEEKQNALVNTVSELPIPILNGRHK